MFFSSLEIIQQLKPSEDLVQTSVIKMLILWKHVQYVCPPGVCVPSVCEGSVRVHLIATYQFLSCLFSSLFYQFESCN